MIAWLVACGLWASPTCQPGPLPARLDDLPAPDGGSLACVYEPPDAALGAAAWDVARPQMDRFVSHLVRSSDLRPDALAADGDVRVVLLRAPDGRQLGLVGTAPQGDRTRLVVARGVDVTDAQLDEAFETLTGAVRPRQRSR